MINGLRDLHRQEGFVAPLPEGVMEFGGRRFEVCEDGKEGRYSRADAGDLKRTTDMIREALMTCEAVIVMVHSHEIRSDNDEEADYFLEEFAHACIDAGACAVIGGGTHQLKGIEFIAADLFFTALEILCLKISMFVFCLLIIWKNMD